MERRIDTYFRRPPCTYRQLLIQFLFCSTPSQLAWVPARAIEVILRRSPEKAKISEEVAHVSRLTRAYKLNVQMKLDYKVQAFSISEDCLLNTSQCCLSFVNVNDLVQANVAWQCEILLAWTAYLIQEFNMPEYKSLYC